MPLRLYVLAVLANLEPFLRDGAKVSFELSVTSGLDDNVYVQNDRENLTFNVYFDREKVSRLADQYRANLQASPCQSEQ